MSGEAVIRVDQVSVRAGTFALGGVSFEVPCGSWTVLMGSTGCGKTTVLEVICGLRRIRSGRVFIRGEDVTHARPAERRIGYVPQDAGLFPRMRVREHLSFALEVGRERPERAVIAKRVRELADLLGLEALLDRRPVGLSGGERQRVALGRALAHRPRVLLLDEPLSALDDDTRDAMYGVLERVRKETGATALHVTHSREAADRLGDVRLVLNGNGSITEVETCRA